MNHWNIVSPNGFNELNVTVNQVGSIHYSLKRKGEAFITESSLGMTLENTGQIVKDLVIKNHSTTSENNRWTPLFGESEEVIDAYTGVTIHVMEASGLQREIIIEFRVYDEGVAFQYRFPKQKHLESFTILSEQTEFNLPSNSFAYEHHGAEGEYFKVPIAEIKDDCERPLTIQLNDKSYLAITEAKTDDYSRMLLSRNPINENGLISTLSGLITEFVGYGNMDESLRGPHQHSFVHAKTPFETPWRVIIIGEKPGDLLENNSIILNLNEPNQLAETDWILPGKILRDMTLSMAGAKSCIHYAKERNFEYMLLDWGWYGDPFDDASYAGNPLNKVWFFNRTNIEENHEINIPEIVQYAKKQSVEVMLYIDRRIVETQLDQVLPIYKEWGIKALKFGFVNTGPQYWTKWLHDAVKKCAEYELAVNIHDAYRPTGISRTYPNLLTQRRIRGNEHMPTARHNATLPFTRFIAGAGDYTICYFTNRKQTTYAHQLAMSIIAFSPMQSIFWYDTPAQDTGEKELEFFNYLPTTWDEKKVIAGEIGEYAILARRKGSEWYIGIITNECSRNLSIPLDFLLENELYHATIYEDDNKVNTKTNVGVRKIEVKKNTVLQLSMIENGGAAIKLSPNL